MKWGGGTLSFGDGATTISPSAGVYGPTLDPQVGIYLFSVTHTYSGAGFYKVTYYEQNLDGGIINIQNSVQTPFLVESGFVIDPLLPNYSFPKFATDPIFSFVTGDDFSFSSAPVEATNSIYNYQMVVPNYVQGYVFPENLKINSQTGLVTWDTKFNGSYQVGQYLFAVRINQFDQGKNFLGYVVRVVTLNLMETSFNMGTSNPVNDPLGKITVLNGNQKNLKLFFRMTLVLTLCVGMFTTTHRY